MRKLNFISLLVMLLSMMTVKANAQSTQLASWTFDTGYDVAENVYTPNSNAWAAVGALWFKDGQPSFIANEAVGTPSDYVMTAMSEGRYWQLCEGYQNKVLRIENADATISVTTPMPLSTMYITNFSFLQRVTRTSL